MKMGLSKFRLLVGGGPGIKVVSAVASSGGGSASADVAIPDRGAPTTTSAPTTPSEPVTYNIELREIVSNSATCTVGERVTVTQVNGIVEASDDSDMTGVTVESKINRSSR